MGVIVIESEEQFDKYLSDSKKDGSLVMVDFFAVWCPPCRMIEPRYKAMSEEFPAVAFLKVDVDALSAVSAKVGISAMPTFILYKAGEKAGEIVGVDEEGLRALITKALG